ncbi:hypothetical protein Poli38472_012471 [Pythium oligandrum]|uniref:Cation/H+ exchanger transmembrane domain-containing protein n=1 Tax=Pythium oligandrum TaxID=41045 RepID=A0A8K1CRE3_PYTOL|nr:hypothetical protein Poli38472_012471 [Pythium oligandrum]|eukprot:TMW67355.1 hypothetical protein Poli38472_012471 [Pythium oligandrum]
MRRTTVRLSLWLAALLSGVATTVHGTALTPTQYGCILQNGIKTTGAGNSTIFCGYDSWFRVQVDLPSPTKGIAPSTNGSYPVALRPHQATCSLDGDVELPIAASVVTGVKDDGATWMVDVNCTFPDDLDEDLISSHMTSNHNFSCVFIGNDMRAFIMDVALPPFIFLTDDYDVTGLTLMNKPSGGNAATSNTTTADSFNENDAAAVKPTSSATTKLRREKRRAAAIETPLIGIGQLAKFQIEVSGAHAALRAATLSGSCDINGQNVTVVDRKLNYIVQRNDSDFVGLKYRCDLVDGVGAKPAKQTGTVRHLVMQIDGTVPEMEEDIFMLFSTDKPARIGSVISITLKAKHLVEGYSGTCEVNGVKDIPLLEADDHGFYMIQYTVSEGDPSLSEADTMPLSCVVKSMAGNTYTFKEDVELGFTIDTIRPKMATTSILFSSDRPAHEGSIIEVQVTLQEDEPHLRVAGNDSCRINNASVGASFAKSTSNTFMLTYVVGKGEAMWKPGALPIYCIVQDAAGNTAVIDHFTDGNTLFARELKPVDVNAVMSPEFLPDKLLMIAFMIVAIASHSISKVCPHIGLPRITGYIVTGILVGPYVLNFLTTRQIRQLRIIDELSMAYIGLTAGSKLHWNRMKPIIRSILMVTIGLTLFEYIIGTVTITVLAGYIDFLQDTTDSEKYAIALLAGCMMIARSPSSALAVIEEVKSQGHFTTLIFAVTVMCDVLVIFLFNVNSMITESFLSEKDMSSNDLLKLVLQICGSTIVGAVLGKIMALFVFWRPVRIKRKSVWSKCQRIFKQFVLLLYGWMIFVICHLAHPYLEPLLCCMVSGAVMWNTSTNPEELSMLLKQLADLVYVSFFTITGATLELDMLVKAMVLSIILCLTRVAAIFLGSFLGGRLANEDPGHSKVAWMAYITQAGVTLGLAKQIQLVYPGWGSYFSTMIVAVVICNQLIGPPLLRYVLRHVGDAKKKEIGKVDGLTALVFSGPSLPNLQSAVLRLETCGWNVHSHLVEESLASVQEKVYVEEVSKSVLDTMRIIKPIEVVVVMMPTDEENFQLIRAVAAACQELKRIQVLRVVVQVAGDGSNEEETKWASRFGDMPATEEHGDTIDVIVVDRFEATDMLIELAACGKVVNIQEKEMSSTAISMEETSDTEQTELEDGRTANVSSGVRLRQKLKHKVRRMMLV